MSQRRRNNSQKNQNIQKSQEQQLEQQQQQIPDQAQQQQQIPQQAFYQQQQQQLPQQQYQQQQQQQYIPDMYQQQQIIQQQMQYNNFQNQIPEMFSSDQQQLPQEVQQQQPQQQQVQKQQFSQNAQIQAPQLNRQRKQVKQNLNSRLVQQKYQFTNLDQEEQMQYQQQQQQFIPQQQIQEQKAVDFNDIINTKQLEEIEKLDENMNYENVFLGKEEAFKDFRILVGQFYTGEGFQQGFLQTAGNELKRIGFKFDIVYDQDQFTKRCMDYDIAYIFSGITNSKSEESNNQFLETIEKFMKASKSLFLWADNDPAIVHSNMILKKFFDGMYLKGSYYGTQIINVGDKHQKQKFDGDHAIAYGLNNLYEGITICDPVKVHKDFEVFAYNSENKPLVLTAEENENHGRIIVDMGYTKLFPQFWKTAGTHQYVSNCTVWLTGIIQ